MQDQPRMQSPPRYIPTIEVAAAEPFAPVMTESPR